MPKGRILFFIERPDLLQLRRPHRSSAEVADRNVTWYVYYVHGECLGLRASSFSDGFTVKWVGQLEFDPSGHAGLLSDVVCGVKEDQGAL